MQSNLANHAVHLPVRYQAVHKATQREIRDHISSQPYRDQDSELETGRCKFDWFISDC